MSTSKDLQFQIDRRREALAELEREIGTIQASVLSTQTERKDALADVRAAILELTRLQTEAEAHNSADLARQIAKQQAAVAKAEERLRAVPPGADEQRLAALCAQADVLDAEGQKLYDRLGWAVLSDAEAELREREEHARAAQEEAERSARAVESYRNTIIGKVAEWPEAHAAALKKYAPKPAPRKREPSPEARVLAAYVQFCDEVREHGPQAEPVVNGVNVASLLDVTPDEIAQFMGASRGHAVAYGNLDRKRDRAADLLRRIS